MSREFQHYMMNPEYDDIRLTGSAQSWALDLVEINWRFLLGAQEDSMARTRGFDVDAAGGDLVLRTPRLTISSNH